jgi:hypothetical protein
VLTSEPFRAKRADKARSAVLTSGGKSRRVLGRPPASYPQIRQVDAYGEAYDDEREVDYGGDEGTGAELGQEREDACAPGEEHVDADHQQDGCVAPTELHVGLECSRRGCFELAT